MNKRIFLDTYTVTFSHSVENHVGMEIIGDKNSPGFTPIELEDAKKQFELLDFKCVLVDLNEALPDNVKAEKASILVIRKGCEAFCDPNELYDEQQDLKWDKKAKQRGKVVNKHARWNLCYADYNQNPDYENGKGRVVSFDKTPLLKRVRDYLPCYVGRKGISLFAEGNYYFNPAVCGIGFHGDAERKIVIAVRLGSSYPLEYQWYNQENKGEKTKPVGKRIHLELDHGDMYIMSQKATGFDWKKKVIPTLRHAAGSDKFLYPKIKGEKAVEKSDILYIT